MNEHLSMMTGLRPSDRVAKFLEENPQANWEQTLQYLVNTFPQVVNDEVEWIVEGGAAMKLYKPERRLPSDVDIITKDALLQREFSNSRKIDPKTAEEWFTKRGLQATEERQTMLLQTTQEMQFEGGRVLVLAPEALAVSKMLTTHRSIERRPEDIADVALLDADPSAVAAFQTFVLGE